MLQDLGLTGLLVILPIALLAMSLRILREYERGVVFQLGRFWKVKGPGLVLVVPGIQQMVRVGLRVVVLDIPSQDIITRDNVSVKVNAVLYFRVVEAQRAIIEVENFLAATSQLAQTTLRAVLGKHDLDDLLAERDRLNLDIQKILDAQTASWGIKVTNVEIKHVDINENMVRAIARQAEAERERRAKVIHAEGELQASVKLAEAAEILARQPAALQLRYLETLTVIGADKNSTIVFPLPLDIIGPLLKLMDRDRAPPPPRAVPAPRPDAGRPGRPGRSGGAGIAVGGTRPRGEAAVRPARSAGRIPSSRGLRRWPVVMPNEPLPRRRRGPSHACAVDPAGARGAARRSPLCPAACAARRRRRARDEPSPRRGAAPRQAVAGRTPEARRRGTVDFIERIFGLSPDGGSGSLEFLLFALPIAGLCWLAARRRARKRDKDR